MACWGQWSVLVVAGTTADQLGLFGAELWAWQPFWEAAGWVAAFQMLARREGETCHEGMRIEPGLVVAPHPPTHLSTTVALLRAIWVRPSCEGGDVWGLRNV